MIPNVEALATFTEDLLEGILTNIRCPICLKRLRFWIDVDLTARKDKHDIDGDLIIYGNLRCTRAGCTHTESHRL